MGVSPVTALEATGLVAGVLVPAMARVLSQGGGKGASQNRRSHKPVCSTLSSRDRRVRVEFYSEVVRRNIGSYDPPDGGMGWQRYAGKRIVDGIGRQEVAGGPGTAWLTLTFASSDAADTARREGRRAASVREAEPQAIGPQGTIGPVIQDPRRRSHRRLWPAGQMAGSLVIAQGQCVWLGRANAAGFEESRALLKKLFGWGTTKSPMGEAGRVNTNSRSTARDEGRHGMNRWFRLRCRATGSLTHGAS